MFSSLQTILVSIALLKTGEAQFAPVRRQANAFSNTVKSRILSASQHDSATAFCASYIHVSTSTVTSTRSSTVTARTSTGTMTSTTTTGNAGTTTSTTTVTRGKSTVTARTCPPSNTKRAAAATVPEPSALTAYPSGRTLSSACSCLTVAPRTSTVSVVSTTTTTPKTTTTSIKTVAGITKVTTTTTLTVPSTTVTTNVPPSTCTPYVQDSSFEKVPSSDLDTDNTDGFHTWSVGGAARFQAGADGYSTPYGSQYVHFYGNQNRAGGVSQANVGVFDTSKTYTLSFATRIVKNNGISTDPDFGDCTLYGQFGLSQQIGYRKYTSDDGPEDSWSITTAQFTPIGDSGQLDISFFCPYDDFDVLVDNVVITGPN